MDTARGIEGGSDNASVRSPSSPERTAPLWLAAAFFAATLAPGAQARDLAGASWSGDTSRLAQAQRTNPAETNPAELQAGSEQEQPRAKVMARDLAAAQRDLISVLTLLQQEREHAALLEQDLASVRRDVETQVVLAGKASDEVTKFKQAAEKGPAELRQSLQKEQEKAEMLAQELSMARARIYAFEAQAREFSDQAAELKQEQERTARLEQDVAAARRDLEKQTALAAKAGEEARQMKQAADSRAELQKSVEQGQERTARLEQDVAAARRDLEKQTARPAKASRQASQTQRRAESSAAGWFNSNSIWNLIFAPQRR
jgi:chromosome segregation ATPase